MSGTKHLTRRVLQAVRGVASVVARSVREGRHRDGDEEPRWRRIVEALPQLVWTATPDGRADYFSPQTSTFTGRPHDAFVGWGWLDALHPDDRASAREQWSRAVAEERAYQAEHRFRRFDGEYRWFSCHGTPVRDADGTIVQWAVVSVDVTERKRAEDRAQKTRQRLELVMRLSQSSFWEVAVPDGDFSRGHIVQDDLMWVHGVETKAIPRVDVPSMFRSVGVLPEDRELVSRAMQQAIDGETADLNVEYRSRDPDGSIRWRLARGAVTRDADGKPTAIGGVGMDVTDLKHVEAKHRAIRERLDFGIRGSGVSIFDLEMPTGSPAPEASTLTLVNFWESLGYDPAEMPLDRTSVTSLAVITDDAVPTAKPMLDYLNGAIPHYVVERRFRRKDGTTKWVLARGTAVRDEHGVAVRFVGTHVDITERKRMEEQLRESELRWRHLAETLPQIVLTTGADGMVDYFNSRIEEYTGVPVSELLGANWASVIHPDDVGFTVKAWTEAVAGQRYHEAEHRLRRHDGVYRWFTTRAQPVFGADGRVYKWFGTSTDITNFKTVEADLQAAREAAERANRAKDEFLANVSHEIRTPMNAILGMTEIALESAPTDHQKQLLSTVKSAAKNLLGIINDLLDFSKIAAGKLALDEADFGLRAEIGDTLRALAPRAHRKGLELLCHVHSDVPDALFGDAGRLRQVLMNLVGNALKFTAKGEIVVAVTLASEASPTRVDDDVALVFEVRDTGIGIAHDKRAAIFRAFEQEDSSTTRRYGGTGLGLTIAAQLTALMNGTITVDSEPGRGSTFAFTARFQRSSRPEEPGARSPVVMNAWTGDAPTARADLSAAAYVAKNASVVSLRILVAEDNELNAALLSTLLGKRGHRAEFADDGRLALKLATESTFDLVLLDLHMPELDGFEVAAAIRERERATGKHLPIIALTARSSDRDRDRCLAAGMDDFLAKPIEAGALWAAIDRMTAAFPPNPRVRLLDPRAISRACGSDPAIFAGLCDVFCRILPDHVTSVRSASSDRDLPRLAGAAHKLLGTLAAFSTIAAGVAAAIEEAARRDDFDSCAPLVDRLDAMCAQLLEETRGVTLDDLSL